jgi:hypothetical protein
MFFTRNTSNPETATTGIAKLHSPSFDPFDPYKQFRKTQDSGTHNQLDSSRSINVFQQVIKIKETRQDSFENHSSYVDGYQYDYKSVIGSQKPDIDLPHSYLSAESAPPSPPSSTISSNKPKKSGTTVPQAENSQFIIGKNKVVNGVYTLMRKRSKYTLNSLK